MKEKHQIEKTQSQIQIQKKNQLDKKYQSLLKEKELVERRV